MNMKKAVCFFTGIFLIVAFSGEISASDSADINCYYIIMDTIPPKAVSISSFNALSYSQIKVTYGIAEDSESGLAASPYFVEAALGEDFSGADDSGWIAATDETFSTLTRNKKYYFRVKAKDKAGNISTSTVKNKKTQPCVWQEKTTTRTGPNAFGFEGDGVWTWKVPADGGSLLTITAFVRYDSNYGGAAKPKITLYNYGVNSSASMTGGADTWEKLTVSGTPSGKGVLFLKVEGFSTAVDAKYFVDDIQVSQ
ncbi:MAG: hypothetical protein J7M11_00680 [Elusimicrobia bacterium]|nr:hypothetical protein [Elusimicrobiota bacterium]